MTSIKHAAEFYDLEWKTAKAIDKTFLQRQLGPLDEQSLRGLEQIAMDEFAIHKGQRYATVVIEPRTRKALWVANGFRDDEYFFLKIRAAFPGDG